jgi:hypothetical protein
MALHLGSGKRKAKNKTGRLWGIQVHKREDADFDVPSE